jgi:hypothetical protein
LRKQRKTDKFNCGSRHTNEEQMFDCHGRQKPHRIFLSYSCGISQQLVTINLANHKDTRSRSETQNRLSRSRLGPELRTLRISNRPQTPFMHTLFLRNSPQDENPCNPADSTHIPGPVSWLHDAGDAAGQFFG